MEEKKKIEEKLKKESEQWELRIPRIACCVNTLPGSHRLSSKTFIKQQL